MDQSGRAAPPPTSSISWRWNTPHRLVSLGCCGTRWHFMAMSLLLSDWSSLHLDVLAVDRGLKRLAASLYEFEPARQR